MNASNPTPDNRPRIAISRRLRSTPFTSRVFEQGVKAFTVYNHMLLPTEFESIEADHAHLCGAVQVWDVGVERQVSLRGPDAARLLQWMTPRDIGGREAGRCVYLPLADEHGRLVNDPVGLKLAEDHWWLSIADSDVLLWARGLAAGARLDVEIDEPGVWPLAVQGPLAEALVTRVFGPRAPGIRFFRFEPLEWRGHPFIVARSGWSKQGGFEIYVDDAALGGELHDELMRIGRDLDVRAGCPNLIERIESGLLAFGNDMDANDSPIEAGLGAFLSLDSAIDALALPALRAERERGPRRRLAGLVLDPVEPGRPAAMEPFGLADSPTSEVRSQVFSPRYARQLATAMLEHELLGAERVQVRLVDGSVVRATVASLPFDFPALGLASAGS